MTESGGLHQQPASVDSNPKPVIVGIGASAGGVAALQVFFKELPPDTGAAFVVIVHLDPGSRSTLAEILGSRTRMPVVEVKAKEQIRANHVYVISPDHRLDIIDHELSAVPFEQPRGQRAPIDLFFRSLGEQLGDGFAVILTGAGSDGAIGVRVVKEAGGIILVQDPAEAEYGSMPRSAIATGIADFILPVRNLAAQLAELIRVKGNVAIPDSQQVDEELLRRILAHLRVRTGHDFSKYKRSTLVRRIARRMQVTRTDGLQNYYDYLRGNVDEAQALLGDLLISVTTFFRDAKAFDALTRDVVPQLFVGKDVNDQIRVWVPGCATGEEVYSIAILLLEEARQHDLRPSFQVFGTDLDARALAFAREGRFPEAIEADVSEDRLRNFFGREPDGYRIRQELRDIALFANHNLLRDPPFSRVDLISCRNLLIYLDRELQEQACSTFHYALNPGSFLFLGSSETADSPPGLFRSINRSARLYRSTAHVGDKPRLLPQLLGSLTGHEPIAQAGRPLTPTTALSEAAAHRRALEQIAPPSMLVDEAFRILHLSDRAGRYIEPSGGPLSGDVTDLVRPELRFELRAALHRAFEHRRPTLSLPLLVQFNGAPHRVLLQVKPLDHEEAPPDTAVVMFIEGEAVEGLPVEIDLLQVPDVTVRRLTGELESAHQQMRTMREESDASNEELRATNEELQSINEEYRSTSEELETSKEELQSINEELQTVNSELRLKLEAVSRANSDLQNLMEATDIGTLFLDSGLRIKRFTDRVSDLFHVTPADAGRPIYDFSHRLDYGDLVKDAHAVLANLVPVHREVRGQNDSWYDVRMRPYRTVDNKIDGVVISFIDLSERRRMEEALRNNERQLREQKRLVELSHEPIFVWDFDDGIIEWNRGSEEVYGYTRDEALGKRSYELLRTDVPGSTFADLRTQLQNRGTWSGELRQRTKDGRDLIVAARIELETVGTRRLILETANDITDRKQWERRQQLLLNEMTHRVKNTLSVIQAIAHYTLRNSASSDDFVERFDRRLSALASSHNLLVQSNWNGADFAALAREQLAPYISDNPNRLRLNGEPITLSADLATPFSLVLHELATNAAKYGALSRPSGSVDLSWTQSCRDDRHMLSVKWLEKGGPPVNEPTASGFGSSMINNGIPSAVVKREFRADGLICSIEVPLPDAVNDGPFGSK